MILNRPKPHRDECLMGYLIRLCQSNAFHSPSVFGTLSGFGMHNGRLPPKGILTNKRTLIGLASRINVPPKILEGMCYHEAKGKLTYQGRSYNPALIRFNSPRVCPECLKEQGYAKSEWLFTPATICVHHGLFLVDTHQKSGERLTWYRKKLDEFRSEAPVAEGLVQAPAEADLNYARRIHSLYLEKPDNKLPNWLAEYGSDDIWWALLFFDRFQNRLDEQSIHRLSTEPNQLAHSHLLKAWQSINSWPTSFHTLLSQYEHHPMGGRGKNGIRKCFRDLYDAIYAHRLNNRPIAGAFRKEFEYYITNKWSKGQIVSSMKRFDSSKATFLNLSQGL